jgi:hypothetical protein
VNYPEKQINSVPNKPLQEIGVRNLSYHIKRLEVAATAIVHLANIIFEEGLVGKKADSSTVIKFAPPAAAIARFGALPLNYFKPL